MLPVQMRAGLLHVMECLSWRCRTAASVAPGAGKGGLQACLDLVAALLHTPCVREVWLAAPSWKTAFEGFLAVKAPSPRDLAACLPFVHWPDAEKLGMDCVSKEAYKRASRDLQAALAAVYERHSELCGLLLATPGADTCARPTPAIFPMLTRQCMRHDMNAQPLCCALQHQRLCSPILHSAAPISCAMDAVMRQDLPHTHIAACAMQTQRSSQSRRKLCGAAGCQEPH